MRKKILGLMIILLIGFILTACKNKPTDDQDDLDIIDQTYLLLMEAEDLSGMSQKTKTVITSDGNLNLPTSYKGVTIVYSSRNKDIISDEGIVTQPNTCWIESRDQQGIPKEDFVGLNDNWPVVVDVTLSYEGQTRTAKLLFVVAPAAGFTCNKYLG